MTIERARDSDGEKKKNTKRGLLVSRIGGKKKNVALQAEKKRDEKKTLTKQKNWIGNKDEIVM